MQKQLASLLKGAGFIVIGMMASKIFTYLWRIILARSGTETYGIFTLGLSIIEVGIMLSFLGPPPSIERFASYYYSKGEKNKALGVIKGASFLAIGSSTVAAMLIFAYAEFISMNIFKTPELLPVIKILAVVMPLVIGSRMLFSSMKVLHQIKYALLTLVLPTKIV